MVMLKFRKIEMTLDPVYKSADQILSRIRRFYCISRTIVMLLLCLVFIGILFLLTYVFFRKQITTVVWIPIGFGCAVFIFSAGMAYYFASMGVRLLRIMKKEGQKINFKVQIALYTFISSIFLFGMLQFSLVQVVNLSVGMG